MRHGEILCLRLDSFPIARLAVRITVRWHETRVCEYVRTCVCEYAHYSPLGKRKILRRVGVGRG